MAALFLSVAARGASAFPDALSAADRLVFVDSRTAAFIATEPDADPDTPNPTHLYLWDGEGAPRRLAPAGTGPVALAPDGALVVHSPDPARWPEAVRIDPSTGAAQPAPDADAAADLLREVTAGKYRLDRGGWSVTVAAAPGGHALSLERYGATAATVLDWPAAVADEGVGLYRTAAGEDGWLAILPLPQAHLRDALRADWPVLLTEADGTLHRLALPWQPAFAQGDIDIALTRAGLVIASAAGAERHPERIGAFVFLLGAEGLMPLGAHPVSPGALAMAPGGCRVAFVEEHFRRFRGDRSPQRAGIVAFIDLCDPETTRDRP